MIVGAHSIIYSKDAEADRRFLRDVLGFPSVDAGGGWLIFGLPASEVAVHPSDGDERHEFYLMSDDIQGFVRKLVRSKVPCSPVHEEAWGSLTLVTLPGGGRLGVYQPKHRRPGDGTRPRKRGKKVPVAAARGKRSRARRAS
jgi:catechol 2,3-dioxygenase-like lactoylglutathione lyase family enzyme